MIKKEIKNLLAEIDANYPGTFKDMDDGKKRILVNTWFTMYQNIDADVVTSAFYVFLATDQKGFAPKPGQLNKIIYDRFSGGQMSEMEAWNLVRKAINNSGYHSEEEWVKLPPAIQKIISPGQLRAWAIDEHGNDSVNASNFMRSYKKIQAQEEQYLRLSGEVKGTIEGLAQRMIGV